MLYLQMDNEEHAKARSSELMGEACAARRTKYRLAWKVHPTSGIAVLCVDEKHLSTTGEDGERVGGLLAEDEEARLFNFLDASWNTTEEEYGTN